MNKESGITLKYAPFACENCRKAHRKCDRSLPSCTYCKKTEKKCQYVFYRKQTPKKSKDKNQSSSTDNEAAPGMSNFAGTVATKSPNQDPSFYNQSSPGNFFMKDGSFTPEEENSEDPDHVIGGSDDWNDHNQGQDRNSNQQQMFNNSSQQMQEMLFSMGVPSFLFITKEQLLDFISFQIQQKKVGNSLTFSPYLDPQELLKSPEPDRMKWLIALAIQACTLQFLPQEGLAKAIHQNYENLFGFLFPSVVQELPRYCFLLNLQAGYSLASGELEQAKIILKESHSVLQRMLSKEKSKKEKLGLNSMPNSQQKSYPLQELEDAEAKDQSLPQKKYGSEVELMGLAFHYVMCCTHSTEARFFSVMHTEDSLQNKAHVIAELKKKRKKTYEKLLALMQNVYSTCFGETYQMPTLNGNGDPAVLRQNAGINKQPPSSTNSPPLNQDPKNIRSLNFAQTLSLFVNYVQKGFNENFRTQTMASFYSQKVNLFDFFSVIVQELGKIIQNTCFVDELSLQNQSAFAQSKRGDPSLLNTLNQDTLQCANNIANELRKVTQTADPTDLHMFPPIFSILVAFAAILHMKYVYFHINNFLEKKNGTNQFGNPADTQMTKLDVIFGHLKVELDLLTTLTLKTDLISRPFPNLLNDLKIFLSWKENNLTSNIVQNPPQIQNNNQIQAQIATSIMKSPQQQLPPLQNQFELPAIPPFPQHPQSQFQFSQLFPPVTPAGPALVPDFDLNPMTSNTAGPFMNGHIQSLQQHHPNNSNLGLGSTQHQLPPSFQQLWNYNVSNPSPASPVQPQRQQMLPNLGLGPMQQMGQQTHFANYANGNNNNSVNNYRFDQPPQTLTNENLFALQNSAPGSNQDFLKQSNNSNSNMFETNANFSNGMPNLNNSQYMHVDGDSNPQLQQLQQQPQLQQQHNPENPEKLENYFFYL